MAFGSQVAALSYAVRLPVVATYLGQLAIVLAGVTLVPLTVSLIFGEYGISRRYAAVVLVLGVAGALLWRMGRASALQYNEGMVITALTFVLGPLVMSYPMMGAGLSLMDAYFEAVSGITTTGLTTLPRVEDMPQSFLFARAWMQWYGGLGIVIFSLAVLIGPGGVAMRLASVEGETDDIASNTHTYARHVVLVYVFLTLIAVAVLWALSGDFYPALLHALTAVSTGGFSSFDNSMAGFENPAVPVAIMFFCVLGAMPLMLYYRTYHLGWREFAANLQVRGLLFFTFLAILLVVATITAESDRPLDETLYHGALVAVSAQTGAGFATVDVASLSAPALVLLMVFMGIGGGVASTTGGVKVLRLMIVFKIIQLIVQRTRMPGRAVVEPHLGHERLDDTDIERAFVIVVLFVMTIGLSWLPFLALGHEPLDALFEVVSATGTVGLSTGITSTDLHPALKGVLCFDMLMGRLELIAIIVLLFPGTWIGRRAKDP